MTLNNTQRERTVRSPCRVRGRQARNRASLGGPAYPHGALRTQYIGTAHGEHIQGMYLPYDRPGARVRSTLGPHMGNMQGMYQPYDRPGARVRRTLGPLMGTTHTACTSRMFGRVHMYGVHMDHTWGTHTGHVPAAYWHT